MNQYPKRLIEVDLPIKRISAHARDEKNMRSGHPWHMHIWWARRPWGACRAVALACLLPAPTDPLCPDAFVSTASTVLAEVGFRPLSNDRLDVQSSLLQFIGEMASFTNGAVGRLIGAARKLVVAAGHKPVVFDSFSGYGAIPAEALRIGAESIACELNPVALLCLKTMLEAVPRHGDRLVEEFRLGADYLKKEAEIRLAKYYPKDEGKKPIAWLWARTVTCEGPDCGASIPLISQTTIANGPRKAWLEVIGDRDKKTVKVDVRSGARVPAGLIKTAGGGHATCPACGFTTHKRSVKEQGVGGRIGHLQIGKAIAIGERQGKRYAGTSAKDLEAYSNAVGEWDRVVSAKPESELNEPYPFHDPRAFTAGQYGIRKWGDFFSPRQKLSLHTIGEILNDYEKTLETRGLGKDLIRDTITLLALAVSNSIHYSTSMSTWLKEGMISCFITGNAIAMRWDWAEANLLNDNYVGGLDFAITKADEALISLSSLGDEAAMVIRANAVQLPLPDDSADLYFTDPPYYDVVPYGDLSDVCFVWLKRFVGHLQPDLLGQKLTPKAEQILVNPYSEAGGRGDQSPGYYQQQMTKAFADGRRVLRPDGLGCIVFAHKGTAAWETLLASIIDAGYMVTASWPIDTERPARMRANNSAALASSVHLVCRPRENKDGSLRVDNIGEWNDVKNELPKRIHEWMPRLASEGVVGADAIFACLGPALEIYSKYSSVVRPGGEVVGLREYLEHIWAAVAKEALNMIFEGADATGFEEDARLTAMWLWTLFAGASAIEGSGTDDESEDSDDEGAAGKAAKSAGYVLEYDAARKIAQGLGAHLEDLKSIIEVKGDKAWLLPVSQRARDLFGYVDSSATEKKRKTKAQKKLFEEMDEFDYESTSGIGGAPEAGTTTLDRIHQTMLLFGAGRSEAVRRFLVDDGVGNDERFWRLANALSALYPSGTDEKRWVDGVLARKKGLGF